MAFLDPNLNFWAIDFPPATELETKASRGLFECGSCKGRETVDLNDVELDVYTINAAICPALQTLRILDSLDAGFGRSG